MLRAPDEKAVAAAQTRLREMFKAPTVEVKNVAAAAFLESISVLQFRNSLYHVPPIPWAVGLQLQRCYIRLQNISILDESADVNQSMKNLEDLEVLMFEVVQFFKDLVRPLSPWQRLTWRWRQPFLDVSQQELGELLGFFSACRMKSSVRYLDPSLPGTPRSSSTASMN